MKKGLLLIGLLLSVALVFAASYYSQGSLAPNLTGSWNSVRDGSGSAPANFTGADSFIIQNGHSMTTSATWAVSNASSMVEIENGGKLVAVTGSPATLTGIFQIDGGGTYVHAVASGTGTGTVPGAAGRRFANSTNGGLGNGTFEIAAQNSTGFSATGIVWGNVLVNNSTQSANIGYAATFAVVEGYFTVLNTNNYQFRLTANQTTAHTIYGNLTVANATSILSFKSGSGDVPVSVIGSLNLYGGTLYLSSSSSGGNGSLAVRGNVNFNSGTLTESTSGTTCGVYFDGFTFHNFDRSGGTISGEIHFFVSIGETLSLGSSVIDGSTGGFTLQDGASLRTSNPDGIASSGASGAIQVGGTRSFGTAANYEYYGSGDFYAGSGLPATVNNFTLNIMGGNLELAGSLQVDGEYKTINGTIVLGNNNFVATGTVSLNPYFVYNGTGTASGIGNNSVITVTITNPSSLPAQMNQLNVSPGTGNIMALPNDVFVPNLVFVSGSLAVGDYLLGVGGSPSGDAMIIYDGTGRMDGNGSTCEITITGTNPGSLPGDTGTLIINVAGTTLLKNNVHVGTFIMLGGSLDLNNYSLYITGMEVDLSGESVITDVGIIRNDTATVVGGTLDTISRVWNISGTSSDPLNVTFFWPTSADNGNTFNAGQCNIWKYESMDWTDLGVHGAALNGDTRSSNIMLTLGAKDGEGDFTITGDDETLPVELSSFTAMINSSSYVQLQWVTQSESNVSGFRIYRGMSQELANALNLNVFVPATNTSQIRYYAYEDTEIGDEGIYYYWLESADLDGNSSFHGPVMVDYSILTPGTPGIPVVQGINRIYPNPFNPITTIGFGISKDAQTRVLIYNTRGQLVRNLIDKLLPANSYILTWDGRDNNNNLCTSGTYIIRMISGSESYNRKMVLMK